eukprot:TRINITY_DN5802_c2_g1_i1.p1 TRINITY_DN5802_c2_g1~~TRINITY_DN5802_c2_g1_i1.p1  ORF type:complete len:1392 (-),score=386.37 TRINITY_DN5802_c2_g1_i1:280-4455(-)
MAETALEDAKPTKPSGDDEPPVATLCASMSISHTEKKDDEIVLDDEIDRTYEPSEKEIVDYADWLGMDAVRDKDLMWIAIRGLQTPLPKAWKACENGDGEIFYYNSQTGQSTWDHPCDEKLRKFYAQELKKLGRPPPPLNLKPPPPAQPLIPALPKSNKEKTGRKGKVPPAIPTAPPASAGSSSSSSGSASNKGAAPEGGSSAADAAGASAGHQGPPAAKPVVTLAGSPLSLGSDSLGGLLGSLPPLTLPPQTASGLGLGSLPKTAAAGGESAGRGGGSFDDLFNMPLTLEVTPKVDTNAENDTPKSTSAGGSSSSSSSSGSEATKAGAEASTAAPVLGGEAASSSQTPSSDPRSESVAAKRSDKESSARDDKDQEKSPSGSESSFKLSCSTKCYDRSLAYQSSTKADAGRAEPGLQDEGDEPPRSTGDAERRKDREEDKGEAHSTISSDASRQEEVELLKRELAAVKEARDRSSELLHACEAERDHLKKTSKQLTEEAAEARRMRHLEEQKRREASEENGKLRSRLCDLDVEKQQRAVLDDQLKALRAEQQKHADVVASMRAEAEVVTSKGKADASEPPPKAGHPTADKPSPECKNPCSPPLPPMSSYNVASRSPQSAQREKATKRRSGIPPPLELESPSPPTPQLVSILGAELRPAASQTADISLWSALGMSPPERGAPPERPHDGQDDSLELSWSALLDLSGVEHEADDTGCSGFIEELSRELEPAPQQPLQTKIQLGSAAPETSSKSPTAASKGCLASCDDRKASNLGPFLCSPPPATSSPHGTEASSSATVLPPTTCCECQERKMDAIVSLEAQSPIPPFEFDKPVSPNFASFADAAETLKRERISSPPPPPPPPPPANVSNANTQEDFNGESTRKLVVQEIRKLLHEQKAEEQACPDAPEVRRAAASCRPAGVSHSRLIDAEDEHHMRWVAELARLREEVHSYALRLHDARELLQKEQAQHTDTRSSCREAQREAVSAKGTLLQQSVEFERIQAENSRLSAEIAQRDVDLHNARLQLQARDAEIGQLKAQRRSQSQTNEAALQRQRFELVEKEQVLKDRERYLDEREEIIADVEVKMSRQRRELAAEKRRSELQEFRTAWSDPLDDRDREGDRPSASRGRGDSVASGLRRSCSSSRARQDEVASALRRASSADVRGMSHQKMRRPDSMGVRGAWPSSAEKGAHSSESSVMEAGKDSGNESFSAPATKVASHGGLRSQTVKEVAEVLKARRRELRSEQADLQEDRRRWREDVHEARKRGHDSERDRRLNATRHELDERAASLNKLMAEHLALEQTLLAGCPERRLSKEPAEDGLGGQLPRKEVLESRHPRPCADGSGAESQNLAATMPRTASCSNCSCSNKRPGDAAPQQVGTSGGGKHWAPAAGA